MSLAFFFLLGTIDRRTFGAGQLRRQSDRYRLLGLLPDLSKRRFKPNQCEIAAQCIHQIRNRIEALRPTSSSFLLALTSPYDSDGKTSLALALGWSYAAAGYRVLLVDCDLVGRGLTRQVGINDRPGLKNVLRNRLLGQEIVARPALHVDVLGAGVDSTMGPEHIRHDDFEALCTELRRQYDIIITDTGPFIGSVEMLPVIACADGVVFSMRRGRSRARLEECIEDLETIRVPTLGVVFNCAQRSDCDRYVSESATSSRQAPASTRQSSSHTDDGDVEHVSNAVMSAVAVVSSG